MERIRDGIFTGVFLVFLGIMAISLNADKQIVKMIQGTIGRNAATESSGGDLLTEQQEDKAFTMKNISESILDELPFKMGLVELSGSVMKHAGVRSYYNSVNGINITRDGYIVENYQQTSTDYEIEQIVGFKEYLDIKGINLLYVNEPAKYSDDNFYQNEFGGESYLNRNSILIV